MIHLLTVLSVLVLLGWAVPLAEILLRSRSGLRLSKAEELPPEELPRLAVIVPALDEAESVEAAMRSLLACGYPKMEVVAVDDRSSDRTGEILDRLALEDPRLRVVHVSSLPAGWLGKTHALHLGSLEAERSRAGDGEPNSGPPDFLLFTDADVHFAPRALQRALAHAQRNGLDFLTLYPDVDLRGFWETACVLFFGFMFVFKFRPWRLANPKSRAYVGIGAFNLVRTGAYRRMGGHESLKLEVADDVKLGKRMREAGGKLECGLSDGLVRVRWVTGVRGLVHGLTKNMFAGFDYRPVWALAGTAGVFLLGVWPVFGVFFGETLARLASAASLALMVAAVAVYRSSARVSPLYGLAFPGAALIVIWIILRSMYFTYRQGGVVWRGTLYPLAELRKASR